MDLKMDYNFLNKPFLGFGFLLLILLLILNFSALGQPLSYGKDSTQALHQGPNNLFYGDEILNRDLGKKETIREEITRLARKYLGIRYRSSGKNPRVGFDCSGFTGFVFRQLGINLRSSSPAQAMEGKKISYPNARKGDLAFFGHRGRKGRFYVNHAAIVISEPGEPLSIIHSASRKGIVITRVNEDPYWRKSLLFVKSVL